MSIITNEINEAIKKLGSEHILNSYAAQIQDNEEEIIFHEEYINELTTFRDSEMFNQVGSMVQALINETIIDQYRYIRQNEEGIKLHYSWIIKHLDGIGDK